MKKLVLLSLGLAIATSIVQAQTISDSLRFLESVWSMKKKEIVVKQMDLTEAEKAAFWPVYDSYNNAIQYLEMEYVQLMQQYFVKAKSESSKKLEGLSERLLKNDLLLAKVRKQYFKKFSRAVSPVLAEQFMQLDNVVRVLIRAELQSANNKSTSASVAFTRN